MSRVTATVPADFDAVTRQARPYPSYLLPKDGTALALFAAGFWGWNDSVHFARAGMKCDFVDTDEQRLHEMTNLYPSGKYHTQDVWEFAETAVLRGDRWDVVSIDPYFGNAAEHCWATMYLWVSLARHLVTLTVKRTTQLNAPVGWDVSYFPRGGNAAWMVMKR